MKEQLLSKIHAMHANWIDECKINLEHVFVEIDEDMPEDVYTMDVDAHDIVIKAKTEAFLFYGLLDLLAKADARDIIKQERYEAKAKERAVHVDFGRKFYSKEWFKKLILLMAENKLNTLQMHMSENLGFRIESKQYPEIVSKEHLSQKDIREIISFAKTYYIEIIPSFDSPGHLEYVLKHFPEHQMPNLKTGLNITSSQSREFIKSLYDEILTIFEGTSKIHMGGDEFINFDEYDKHPELKDYAEKHLPENATAADTFIDYINDIGRYLMEQGREVRIWNDGFYRLNIDNHLDLDRRFVITYWTSWNENMAPLQTFIDKGHRIVNYNDQYLYYVVGECAGYRYPSYEKIKEGFDIEVFPTRHQNIEEGQRAQKLSADHEQFVGSTFSIWSDEPKAKTEDEIMHDLINVLPAFADKFWVNL